MIQQIYPQVTHGYRFELNKDMNFAAAHFLPDPDAGSCANMHGHTYFCNITVAGDSLDRLGMLVNFGDLKKLIHGRYDHQALNDVTFLSTYANGELNMPSTEAVASEIWFLVQRHLNTLPNKSFCVQVFLRETPTSYVVYRPAAEDFTDAL